jgi:hypothetical protein
MEIRLDLTLALFVALIALLDYVVWGSAKLNHVFTTVLDLFMIQVFDQNHQQIAWDC